MGSINEDTSIICFNCKKDNPAGAKFCNKCGTRFPLKCPNCNNSNNFPDAVYCNDCGVQIKNEKPTGYGEVAYSQLENTHSRQSNIDDYDEYSLPEYNFKIRYHPEWEKTDGEDLRYLLNEEEIDPQFFVAIFKPSIYHLHSSISNALIIHVFDAPVKVFLRDYATIQIRNLKQDHPDFSLEKSNSLVINGKTWHHMSFFMGGFHHLRVFTFSENKLYMMRFFSTPHEYDEYVSVVESMIRSFEFIYSPRLGEADDSQSQEMTVKNGFVEFSDSKLRFKINYPTSWIKMINSDENNVFYFQKLHHQSEGIKPSIVINVVDFSIMVSDTSNSLDEQKEKAFKELNIKEKVSTTLGGLPATQIRSKEKGFNRLSIICENYSKLYFLTYLASPDSFDENFMTAEQIISSFEFL